VDTLEAMPPFNASHRVEAPGHGFERHIRASALHPCSRSNRSGENPEEVMDKKNIIRAWKDPEYRASLAEAPESPAGAVELEDAALESVAGGLAAATVVAISLTHGTEGCTVSGWRISCGWVCTLTTECFC
jgi:mersacidin/lichenicidin family type 2 lantibiotic